MLNGLRVIPDVQYQPVPLLPTVNPGTGRPLDLSRAQLRSVSPIHLEYLRNMNVGASLTISLVVNGKLWGLAACHHRTPRFVSPALREVCELFGQIVSLRLAERLQSTRKEVAERSKAVLHRLADRIEEFGSIIPALLADENELLQLTNAQGAILWRAGEAFPIGTTPPLASVSKLMQWVVNATPRANA